MNPFDKVTIDVEKGDTTFTYGAVIIATYEEDSTEMAIVSILGTGDVIHCEQSDLTAI